MVLGRNGSLYVLYNELITKRFWEIKYSLCTYCAFFIVLYPIGVSGEMITVWYAKKDFGKYILWNNGKINITVADLVYPVWVLYIPALIFLYGYLFKQRKKVLGRLNNKENIINIKKKKNE